MLAFTRKINESFLIGDDIVVTIIGRDALGNVQLVIDAPPSASIDQKEFYTKEMRTISKE